MTIDWFLQWFSTTKNCEILKFCNYCVTLFIFKRNSLKICHCCWLLFKLLVKWEMSLSKLRESFGGPYLALNARRKYTHRLCLFSTLAENEMLKKRPNFESQSVPRGTGTLDGRYNYVPLGSRKPCLYVRSWWPNLEWRMYNSNNLRYIADFLVRCNIIKNVFLSI